MRRRAPPLRRNATRCLRATPARRLRPVHLLATAPNRAVPQRGRPAACGRCRFDRPSHAPDRRFAGPATRRAARRLRCSHASSLCADDVSGSATLSHAVQFMNRYIMRTMDYPELSHRFQGESVARALERGRRALDTAHLARGVLRGAPVRPTRPQLEHPAANAVVAAAHARGQRATGKGALRARPRPARIPAHRLWP